MVKASRRFIEEILMPEFEQFRELAAKWRRSESEIG
jgi:hypothetical protein